MKNERLSEEQKNEILSLKGQGMRPRDIAEKLNLSESGVYRVIQMARVMEIPIVDDSKAVRERENKIRILEEKIQKLEHENELLQEDNRRLLSIVDRLVGR